MSLETSVVQLDINDFEHLYYDSKSSLNLFKKIILF
jgi:hypothetical protein